MKYDKRAGEYGDWHRDRGDARAAGVAVGMTNAPEDAGIFDHVTMPSSAGRGLQDFDPVEEGVVVPDGYELRVRCTVCGWEQLMTVSWLEILALAHDLAPQTFMGQLSEVTVWRREHSGVIAPGEKLWRPALGCSSCRSRAVCAYVSVSDAQKILETAVAQEMGPYAPPPEPEQPKEPVATTSVADAWLSPYLHPGDPRPSSPPKPFPGGPFPGYPRPVPVPPRAVTDGIRGGDTRAAERALSIAEAAAGVLHEEDLFDAGPGTVSLDPLFERLEEDLGIVEPEEVEAAIADPEVRAAVARFVAKKRAEQAPEAETPPEDPAP